MIEHVQISGTIQCASVEQARIIHTILVALGWKGGVRFVTENGGTRTEAPIDLRDDAR